jgi:hypothetical protein
LCFFQVMNMGLVTDSVVLVDDLGRCLRATTLSAFAAIARTRQYRRMQLVGVKY